MYIFCPPSSHLSLEVAGIDSLPFGGECVEGVFDGTLVHTQPSHIAVTLRL